MLIYVFVIILSIIGFLIGLFLGFKSRLKEIHTEVYKYKDILFIMFDTFISISPIYEIINKQKISQWKLRVWTPIINKGWYTYIDIVLEAIVIGYMEHKRIKNGGKSKHGHRISVTLSRILNKKFK